jgi:hypothetical protein
MAATFAITASGAPSPAFSLTGVLPQGVTFDAQTGIMSGTPGTGSGGDYPLTIRASNGISPNAIQNFTLTVNAAGIASRVSLPKTGQTDCWDAAGTAINCGDTGQDGDLQMGIAWPSPRFIDNGDQTITDNLTGLIWARDANLMQTRDPSFDTDNVDSSLGDGKVTWQHSLDYIKKLNMENYQGHNDWRLSNVVELSSLLNTHLINFQLHFPVTWLNGQGFFNAQEDYYWSSTSTAVTPFGAWGVDIYYGGLIGGYNKTSSMYVWPVRGGQSGSTGTLALPRTGQTGCWDTSGTAILCAGTGQDGELQMGVAWPSPRFIDNGDQTVTDNLTGLVWTKDAHDFGPAACVPAETRSWQEALNYVMCLNTTGYLGKSDWRLPNPLELRSLVNYQAPRDYLWLNGEGFSNVQDNFYWSSSTVVKDFWTDGGWLVDMVYGVESGIGKPNGYFVWPVRTGD